LENTPVQRTSPVIETFPPHIPKKKDCKEKKFATPKTVLKSSNTIKPQQVIANDKCKNMGFH